MDVRAKHIQRNPDQCKATTCGVTYMLQIAAWAYQQIQKYLGG